MENILFYVKGRRHSNFFFFFVWLSWTSAVPVWKIKESSTVYSRGVRPEKWECGKNWIVFYLQIPFCYKLGWRVKGYQVCKFCMIAVPRGVMIYIIVYLSGCDLNCEPTVLHLWYIELAKNVNIIILDLVILRKCYINETIWVTFISLNPQNNISK